MERRAMLQEQAEKAQKIKQQFNQKCEHLRNFFSLESTIFSQLLEKLKKVLQPSSSEVFNEVVDAFLKQK